MEQESVGGRAPWPHLPRHTLHCGPALGCSVGAAALPSNVRPPKEMPVLE